MKNITFLLFIIPFLGMAQLSQADMDAIAADSCNCIGEISSQLPPIAKSDQIESCIASAITTRQVLGGLDNLNTETVTDPSQVSYELVIDPTANIKEVTDYLWENCPVLKTLVSNDNAVYANSLSDNEEALKLFDAGSMAYQDNNFEEATSLWEQALEIDSNFAFAWDNLAIAYRQLERYEDAITAYEKSFEVEPKSIVPLTGMAVIFEFQEDFNKASNTYEQMIKLHPDNPEGYFGLGRSQWLLKNYEIGLDNVVQAYLIYSTIKSPYMRDAEQVLVAFYRELKSMDRLDIYNRVLKKHNIQTN